MSNYWCNLPKKVLNIIFLYVKANDKAYNSENLSQCSLTCRDWRAPAQTFILSEVFVNTTNNIDSLTRIVMENEEFRKWVKVLKYSKTCGCNAAVLLAADLSFPNLEALDFCGNNVLYSFFGKMLIENGNFKNLTKLPIPANKEQDLMYSQCLDYLQERITSITLFEDETNDRDIYQGVIKKLDRFPRLKKVLIHTTTTDMRYQNLATYIYPIIENNLASSLKELCITSSVNTCYYFRLSTQGEQGLLPMTKLKSLNIYMYNSDKYFTISEDFILFIMHQCPNLDSLYVEFKDGAYFNYQSALSCQQNILKFMVYLLEMPNFSLKNSALYTKNATQLIEDCYTAIEKKPGSLKLSRTLFITAHSMNSATESFGVIDFKNDYSMQLHSINFRIRRASSTPAHKIDEEQIQLVEKIGHFFNTVSLQITSPEYLETFLKCVAAIRTGRLNTLIIEGLSGSLCKESFFQDKKIAHSNRIKELVLSNFCLSQEQLLHLSVILPRLRKLTLKNFFKHKSLLSGKSFFLFCLPSWSLNCLEINMDLNFTGSQKEEKYYIKLAVDGEHSSRYCFFTVKITDNKVTGYRLIDHPTQAAFQESIFNQEISTYYICCESVKEFTFKYIDAENGYHKTLCLFGKQSIV